MGSTLFINGVLGLAPVTAFLALLIQFDTFKLVRRSFVFQLIAAGALSALAAQFLSKAAIEYFQLGYGDFIRFGAPMLEEALKAIVIIFLIRTNRIGFALDAVIAGFAIGAGFALLENYFYLQVLGRDHPAIWVVRGFGTAIMHGGTAAIFAISAQLLTPQRAGGSIFSLLPGFIAAVVVHTAFNQFLAYPVSSTLVMMLGLATVLGFSVLRSAKSIDLLLEQNYEHYRTLLDEIRSGAFSEQRLGGILKSLRLRLDPSEAADIVRYAERHTELILLSEEALKEQRAGNAVVLPPSVGEKLAELHYLEERLGRAVRIALAEYLPYSRKDFYQLYKLARDGAKPVPLTLSFNSDLLLEDTDREAAKKAFPNVAFALDHETLRKKFAPIDERANRAKRVSRRQGVAIVLLATLALFFSAAHTLYAPLQAVFVNIIASFGAAAIFAALAISFFGLNGRKRKKHWLADRLATERIRQFHFQHYAIFASEILAAAKEPSLRRAYINDRDRRFEGFRVESLDRIDEQLHQILLDQDFDEGMLSSLPEKSPDAGTDHIDEYFSAYAALRFERQLNYCNHVLRESRNLKKPSIMRQAQVLGAVALTGLCAVLLLQAGVFIGLIAGFDPLLRPVISIATMWAALTALAAETIRSGLQPRREIERMRQYRNALRRIHFRFRNAENAAVKISAMLEMEKICFDEIVLFLRSNHEAEFVL